MRPQLAVRAIILDACGRVLVLRRAAGSMGAGRWCLPGGKVEFGETPRASLEKEVREETGLACRSVRFLFHQDSLPGPSGPLHFVNLYFECHTDGEVMLNRESSEHVWIGRDELERYDLAFGHEEAMRQYWG